MQTTVARVWRSPFFWRRFTHLHRRDRPRTLWDQLKSLPSPIGMLSDCPIDEEDEDEENDEEEKEGVEVDEEEDEGDRSDSLSLCAITSIDEAKRLQTCCTTRTLPPQPSLLDMTSQDPLLLLLLLLPLTLTLTLLLLLLVFSMKSLLAGDCLLFEWRILNIWSTASIMFALCRHAAALKPHTREESWEGWLLIENRIKIK